MHSVQLTKGLFRNFSAAFFVFFAASARTWVVSADFGSFYIEWSNFVYLP